MTLPRMALDPVMSQTFMSGKKLRNLPRTSALVKWMILKGMTAWAAVNSKLDGWEAVLFES